MCRLFGMVSEKPEAISYWMLDALRPFRSWSDVHCHGWGIGSYENGQPNLIKEPVSAKESPLFEKTSVEAKSSMVIGHIRKMTRGRQVIEDTHPFQYGQWLFGHNGTIDADYFRERLNATHHGAVTGNSDSEVYFHYLLQGSEAGREPGLLNAIDEIRAREFSALNFILTDSDTLLVYWDQVATAAQSLTPFYYQLYYTVRNSVDTGGKQVIVCSEKLDNLSWLEIPPRQLLKVSRACRVEFVPAR